MDKDAITNLTIKALRAAEKTAPGKDTGLIWLLMLLSEEKGEHPYLIVSKTLRPEVREAFKAHRSKGRWARGLLKKAVDLADGFDFVIEDSKKIKPKEATRLLRLVVAADDLKVLKDTLKSSRFVDPKLLEEETEGEERETEEAELQREQARCEEAREKAKEAFLAAKSVVSGEVLAQLIALRDQATEARKNQNFEEATELYLDLVDQCKASAASSVDLAAFAARWREAIEEVDRQIEALAKVLRASGDEELIEIADQGLYALTGNHRVPFEAALREGRDAEGEARQAALEKLSDAARSFHDHIMNEEIVAVTDDNPFGVQVSIRSTLGPPLAELAAL